MKSVRIVLDTSGTFDDSIALDIDADGIVDYIMTQDDAYQTPGIGSGSSGYRPWVSAIPYTFDAVITNEGTTLLSSWDGITINVGAGAATGDAGFNNVSGFNLFAWGFGVDGTITGADFTTNEMRLGNINTDGPGGHDIAFTYDAVVIEDINGEIYIFDPDDDGLPANVPESSQVPLIVGLGALLVSFRRSRRSI